MKRNLKYLVLALAAVLSAPSADAVLILSLDDTMGNTATVVDGDADGVVVFNGSLGVWTVNVSTGLSKPLLGSDANPHMDLNTVNFSSDPGTLILTLSDSFVTAAAGSVRSDLGGTINGGGGSLSAVVSTSVDGPTGAAHNHAGGGAFSSTAFAAAPAAPYDLVLTATLEHTTRGNSSFDWDVTHNVPHNVPDSGTSAVLLGLSLLGFFGVSRKIRRS